jgi:hypothetical protein
MVLGAAHRDIKISKISLMSRYSVALRENLIASLQILQCAAPFQPNIRILSELLYLVFLTIKLFEL